MYKFFGLVIVLIVLVIVINGEARASNEWYGSSEERYYPRYGGHRGYGGWSGSHERYYGRPAYYGGGIGLGIPG